MRVAPGRRTNMRVCVTILVIVVTCLLPVVSCADQATNDTAILSEVLRHPDTNGNFTVVAPMTTLSTLIGDDPEDLEQSKKYVIDNLKVEGKHVADLFKRLIDKNKTPVRLELPSSPKDGYLIDYDGKFDKYFIDDGGGWDHWYKENPKAMGWTRVSLPAYDPKTNLVLIYKGTQSHWLAGAGHLILYKYQNGKLRELGRLMLWIS